ncbi:SusD/RagB family nutrient-binding outer membrane lipoprotein [Chryseobacterium rhizosphaerae]|uniref:SusD/RagB family nutrient-binding outer membrane lipoprotein n=1 Tax=Chryseobacterium rhizosphaerae TaxID=395937 RepID=A0ABX9IRQ4_9FLAO|nr:SusD/RagB family nutrient-binding outer membrane lipoprotein [Chryseobacterium rhizosphaerae]REC79002.1 SusD/RagB family nutrient-binding outer membrane lipoprotein [Chryseobacterium rhizosphaerae]GEN68092.1 hypothetical protein CRH01_26600 [Chryseobacterium rhizosphaerae]
MKKIGIISLLIILFFNSCSTDDINKDPNSAYTTTAESLVSYAEKALSDYNNTPNVNTNNFRLLMQYWQETTYVSESNYNFVNRNVADGVWNENYVKVLNNLQKAREIINAYSPSPSEISTWDAKKKGQLAIIDLLMVYTYQTIVDTFGDVPYSQSLQLVKYPLPVYDKGADIYVDLIKKTQEALTNLNGTPFGDGEYFYKGNSGKWKVFGNSLLLKLSIGIADSNPTLAQQIAQVAISGGVMMSSADGCQLPYQLASPNFNPLYSELVASGRDDFIAAETLVDYMINTNDPRISSYYQKNKDGVYVGQQPGKAGLIDVFSRIGTFAYTRTTPGTILSYTEVAFYKAEAAARWNTGNAAIEYENAVRASMKEWNIADDLAVSYIAAHPYDNSNWKKSVGEQAWVSMFNQGLTSWNFYRRLDYPVLIAPETAISNAGGKVPVRLQYPGREQTTNGTNWSAASAAIGGDRLTTKLFWDKN